MTNISNKDKIYFQHLDVVRFLAAFMIVILHAYEAWNGWFGHLPLLSSNNTKEFSTIGVYIDLFIRNLGIGVDIFFVISGFLITYILLEEKKRFGRISIFKFMVRRSLRIWPLYFFIIALAPFLVAWVNKNPPDYLYNLLFLNNFNGIQTQRWTYPFGHFWSICVEEHFYIVWPFIIALIPKKRLLPTFYLLIFGSILFRIWTLHTSDHVWYELFLHTISRVDVIIIGAIGAYYYSEKKFEFKLSRNLRVLLLVVLVLALSIESVALWNTAFLAGFKKYFYVIIFSVLLLDFNLNTNYKHLIPNKSIFHYLGKVSYGIYMYSNVLLLIVIKKIMWVYEIKSAFAFFAIIFTLSIVIPIISYELFEKHILKLNKFFRVIKTER